MALSAPLTELNWIAVDWGTSSLRVWAMGGDGTILTKAASQEGMAALTPDSYEPALLKLIGGWLPERPKHPLPVIVCGMAGAKQGWKEAAYRSVPCSPVSGRQMTPVTTADPRLNVSIVPGLCQSEPSDVMRGEETQLAGLMERIGEANVTVCMPGTHSKWARLEGNRLAGFMTFMTGELFSVTADHSILRLSLNGKGEDEEVFLDAVMEMLDQPERLTSALFSIRASGLLAGTAAQKMRSRLSGLLIGVELAATRAVWEGRAVHLVGARPLVDSYTAALQCLGARPIPEDAEALTLSGLAQVRTAMTESFP